MKKHTVIVWVVGLYIACQLIADVAATRFVELGGVVMPAGTFIFAITFTLRDVIHKRLGKEWARQVIIVAAFLNILLSGYLWAVSKLPAPVWFELSDSWTAVFAIVPAITIGSIVAELVSELVDTEVYHYYKTRFPNAPQWSRVLTSNVVALPIDTIVFSLLAFTLLPPLFGGVPIGFLAAVTQVASGQIIYKAAVTVLSLPLIYTVSERPLMENHERLR